MKSLHSMLIMLLFAVAGCSSSTPSAPPLPVEVTRIVIITVTPIPASTLTPQPTLDPVGIAGTKVAEAIGTPIKASDCYQATDNQGDMNDCSNRRRTELEVQMSHMVDKVGDRYTVIYGEESLFLPLQAEWEDLAKRDCEFRSGYMIIETDGILHYRGGSMALTGYNECLIGKYEDRLRELQIQFYELNI